MELFFCKKYNICYVNSNHMQSNEQSIAIQGLNENDFTFCPDIIGGAEDIEMGRCLANLNVTSGDTRFLIKKESNFDECKIQIKKTV